MSTHTDTHTTLANASQESYRICTISSSCTTVLEASGSFGGGGDSDGVGGDSDGVGGGGGGGRFATPPGPWPGAALDIDHLYACLVGPADHCCQCLTSPLTLGMQHCPSL